MVLPNTEALTFCNWLLNISWQKLSGPQRVLVEIVYNAADTATSITDLQWQNFNKFTAWRYPFFRVYYDLAIAIPSTLLTDLYAAYNFDGDSTDSANGHDGVDSNMSYPTPSGSLGQSAAFNGVSSKITTPTFTPAGDFSLAFRLWIDPATVANAGIYGPLANNYGPYYLEAAIALQFPANVVTGGSAAFTKAAWYNFVITSNAGTIQFYTDTAAVGIPGTLTVAPDLSTIGFHLLGWWLKGYINYLFVWNKVLSTLEIAALYNGGAGLKYPFT